MTGVLQSDYYQYQDAGERDHFIFTQTLRGQLAPEFWRGWRAEFLGELRDSNDPYPGSGGDRLLGLSFAGDLGPLSLAFGRIASRVPGPSLLDGIQASLHAGGTRRITIAAGREVYPIYRSTSSYLPERYRAGGLLEGSLFLNRTKWQIEHVARFLSDELDDQTTALSLRCRRFTQFGGDARINFDWEASAPRELALGIRYFPLPLLRLEARYSERRIRIYQSSFLSQYELKPTKIASLKARCQIGEDWLWLSLGYARRPRSVGDLDRISASIESDYGELGLRWQGGTDMNQIGGWLDAYGRITDRLSWSVALDFDRWDSAWDAEAVEAWANEASLAYELSPEATMEGRIEHFRDDYVRSDVRGWLTFKLRYGL